MLPIIYLLICLFSFDINSGLCLAYSNAENTFNYDNPTPNYIVGKEITPNKPNVTIEEGIFSISPLLSKGLSLDSTNGILSGTPEEEYQSVYTVMLTLTDGSIMKSELEMKSIRF